MAVTLTADARQSGGDQAKLVQFVDQRAGAAVVDINAFQAVEQAFADLLLMLVVVARQVVGFEDHLERLDVGQRQVVERHVADQLPEKVAVQWRRVAGGDWADVAKGQELRRVFAGQADVTQTKLARQVLVGASKLDGQRLVLVEIAQAEAKVCLQPIA